MEKKVQRLILKEEDVLVVKVPVAWMNRQTTRSIYEQIKKKLLPRKNKVLLLPSDIDLSVISEKQVKEHISNIDLWSLWDEEGEELGEGDIENV